MIKVQQKQSTPVSVIRAASERELADYEKNKLATIEENAQQNKLEVIRLNGARIPIDPDTKTANIKVGDLAFKSAVTSSDIDNNELFFIRCALD
jgi:hypothetical protein